MTNIAVCNVEKCKRILESIEARDTSAVGYQAQLRHAQRLEQARRTYEEALAERSKTVTVGSVDPQSV